MPKIAIVHDYFIQEGGAEKVADQLQRMFPEARMFTTVSKRDSNGSGQPAVTSWMQKLPVTRKNHRYYFLLYPFAVESLDLTEYDIIITSTSGYAKGVRKREDAIHICYCHTPMRWVWLYDHYAKRENFGRFKRGVLPLLLKGLRIWDLKASQRPDHYIANSRFVAERIRQFYGREATVIPPPIDVNRFKTGGPQMDFYLILSRLVSYKRLDIAIEACKRLDRELVVIGDGAARADLERIAGEKTVFLGHQPDEVVNKYASQCRALIFPGEEDFGMTPLEINAAGRPVIAFKSGGAIETVIHGRTGMFFEEQNAESLSDAIMAFEEREWDPEVLRNHAREFDSSVFEERILGFVSRVAGARLGSYEKPEAFGVQTALKKGVV